MTLFGLPLLAWTTAGLVIPHGSRRTGVAIPEIVALLFHVTLFHLLAHYTRMACRSVHRVSLKRDAFTICVRDQLTPFAIAKPCTRFHCHPIGPLQKSTDCVASTFKDKRGLATTSLLWPKSMHNPTEIHPILYWDTFLTTTIIEAS